MTSNTFAIVALLTLLGLGGCERDGPAERLGESLDDAASELQGKADDLGNDIEDACEALKKKAGTKDTDC